MRESPPFSSAGKPALPVADYQDERLNGQLEALLRVERNDADTGRELAGAIRAGRYDADITGLAAALEPDVRARLEVTDPRYLADYDPFR